MRMQKIIDGKRYNTATATLIGSASDGSIYDFRAWAEELYITPKGAFFLVGVGGPMTKYAERIGQHGRCEGEDLIPLSQQQALAWLEEHQNDPEIIERYFAVEEA